MKISLEKLNSDDFDTIINQLKLTFGHSFALTQKEEIEITSYKDKTLATLTFKEFDEFIQNREFTHEALKKLFPNKSVS